MIERRSIDPRKGLFSSNIPTGVIVEGNSHRKAVKLTPYSNSITAGLRFQVDMSQSTSSWRHNYEPRGSRIQPPAAVQPHTNNTASCPLTASDKWTGVDCSAPHAGVIPSLWVWLWKCEAGERRRCEGTGTVCACGARVREIVMLKCYFI